MDGGDRNAILLAPLLHNLITTPSQPTAPSTSCRPRLRPGRGRLRHLVRIRLNPRPPLGRDSARAEGSRGRRWLRRFGRDEELRAGWRPGRGAAWGRRTADSGPGFRPTPVSERRDLYRPRVPVATREGRRRTASVNCKHRGGRELRGAAPGRQFASPSSTGRLAVGERGGSAKRGGTSGAAADRGLWGDRLKRRAMSCRADEVPKGLSETECGPSWMSDY